MLEPVKIAFGHYMGAFYAGIAPTTTGLHEYVARGLAKSIVWAPSRMVDAIEDMLSAWQRNDTDGAPTQPAKMPIIFVAIAKDYTTSGRDYTRQITGLIFHLHGQSLSLWPMYGWEKSRGI